MTHPHHQHAAAALWSLWRAWPQLETRLREEDRAQAMERDEMAAADGLQAWRPTSGRTSGTPGNPVLQTALASTAAGRRVNPWRELRSRTGSTLAWLADQLDAPEIAPAAGANLRLIGHFGEAAKLDDAISRLIARTLELAPAAAANLTRWVREADTRVRLALGLAEDAHHMPGEECRACGVRLVYVQTAAPDRAAWTIVCMNNGCRCGGAGCSCGMAVPSVGVQHIWRAVDIVAVTT